MNKFSELKPLQLFFLFNGISLFMAIFLGGMIHKYLNIEYISIAITILRSMFLIILTFATGFSWNMSIKEFKKIIKFYDEKL